MTISCLIPTFRRPAGLTLALQSLQQQTLDAFEIIVIDNEAAAETRARIEEMNRTARLPIRYVAESRLGLHYARHAGVRAATGDVLVFTDDDATFDPRWLAEYAAAFEAHPDMAAAGGPVRPVWETPPPAWMSDYFAHCGNAGILSLMEPHQEFRKERHGYFFGVNMAIRRQIVWEVGGFNPDSFGDIWLGDGECGLNRKLWQHGLPVGYVPTALVWHHIPPSRMTLEYFRQRMRNQAASDLYAEYHRRRPSTRELIARAFRVLIENKCWLSPLLRYRTRLDPHGVDVRLQAALTFGQFQYLCRLIASPRLRTLVTKDDWLTDRRDNDCEP